MIWYCSFWLGTLRTLKVGGSDAAASKIRKLHHLWPRPLVRPSLISLCLGRPLRAQARRHSRAGCLQLRQVMVRLNQISGTAAANGPLQAASSLTRLVKRVDAKPLQIIFSLRSLGPTHSRAHYCLLRQVSLRTVVNLVSAFRMPFGGGANPTRVRLYGGWSLWKPSRSHGNSLSDVIAARVEGSEAQRVLWNSFCASRVTPDEPDMSGSGLDAIDEWRLRKSGYSRRSFAKQTVSLPKSSGV
jgi:hypothetical protein